MTANRMYFIQVKVNGKWLAADHYQYDWDMASRVCVEMKAQDLEDREYRIVPSR